ncbi:MAG: hypothetical protein IIX61_08050, partial [Loktanella sp.]|nr:hypothetical protein [Loktanella sp.]
MDRSAIAQLQALGHEVVEQFYEPDALGAALRDFDAVVVRSKTKVRQKHIDEALGGFARSVRVTLHKDGSATVEDDGRGMPVDIHPELGITGVEMIFTRLHAGGKFDHQNYDYSGGLHGVGASVVNALSKWVTVEVSTGGGKYRMRFESNFDPAENKIASGRAVGQLERIGATRKHGTKV